MEGRNIALELNVKLLSEKLQTFEVKISESKHKIHADVRNGAQSKQSLKISNGQYEVVPSTSRQSNHTTQLAPILATNVDTTTDKNTSDIKTITNATEIVKIQNTKEKSTYANTTKKNIITRQMVSAAIEEQIHKNALDNIINLADENKGFNIVRRKKPKQKPMIGEGDKENNKYFFEGRYKKPEDKKIWIFISKVRDDVEASTVQKFIQEKTKAQLSKIAVKHLATKTQSKNNKCFLIGVENQYKDQVYNTKFWPTGVAFSRFNFKIGHHFLKDGISQQLT
ncbi:hypothetical protein WA026_017763 [Henosepilachna vigintioctopunctata]|uniref:Uncharacterized protein n=2 Tax=Henosepilachna vigintioctopunctata TaxID=420089 RepID=A0AAW1UBS3_9CUCU